MALTKEHVAAALASLRHPSGRPFDESGVVRKIAACDNNISVTVAGTGNERADAALKGVIDNAIRKNAAEQGEEIANLNISIAPAEAPAPGETSALPGVRHVIAVGAGKGGVGKSTVSVNLAIALARQGRSVGLLDGDIYGPSAPTLLGLENEPVNLHQNMLQVFNVHGIKAMTIGKLVEPDKPLIWRGPMAHGAFKQLVEQTSWGELDYLIIDLPPGTGDVPLTMAQMLSLTGAVIVCTPQKVAQDDAVRAARMFQQLKIDILGVVENMSFFIGDDGKEYDIFGRGGAEQMAQRLGLPFLGAIPISMPMREFCDAGQPTKNFTDTGDDIRAALENVAKRVEDEVALNAMRSGSTGPVLSVS